MSPIRTFTYGTEEVYGSTCHQLAVPISGDPEVFFGFLTRGNSLFFKKRLHGRLEIRAHDQRPIVLPTTPFVKALGRWATSKRLTNRLPKLSLITGASAKGGRNRTCSE